MTDLPAATLHAVHQPVVDHHPASDSRPDGQQDEIGTAGRRSEPVLGRSQRANIVLHHHRHWGADPGDLDRIALANLARAAVQAVVTNVPDEPVSPSVLAEHSTGWMGLPGLLGHRGGGGWSTRFEVITTTSRVDGDGTQRLVADSRDEAAGLDLSLTLELTPAGVPRLRATVTGSIDGPTGGPTEQSYTLDGLTLTLSLPVPARAAELLDFTGRHLRERHPQRRAFDVGSWVRENRRGRTGSDATMLLAAGTPGFGFGSGEVWALHTAWSGNHRTLAERTPNGHAVLSGGELLLPGEITLGPGISTPRRGSTVPSARGWTRFPPVSTGSCAPGRSIPAPPGRSS